MKTMKALDFNGGLKIVKKEIPIPQKGTVLVKVLETGICNTDLEIVKGYMGFRGTPGHEFVGVVEKAENPELVGKRVVSEINWACGKCDICKMGLYKHCRNIKTLGIKDWDGAFAEYVMTPVDLLHLIPENVTNRQAVFVEPLAAAIQVLEQVHIRSTSRVSVIGDGKLGLLISMVLSSKGIKHILIGKHFERLSIVNSKEVVPINLKNLDAEKFNKFFDVVIEATGNPNGFKMAAELARPEGEIILKSTYSKNSDFDFAPVVVKELKIIGSRCGPFEPAIEMLSKGKIKPEPLISGVYKFDNILEAFEQAKGSMKIVVEMGEIN